MIETTCDFVENKKIKQILGVVWGRDDMLSGDNSIPSGFENMRKEAQKLNADAIIGIRITLVAPLRLAVYGTAVKLG